MDELGLEIRCNPLMVALLAAHAPVLRKCWHYWNTQHGLRGRSSAANRPSSVAVEQLKEVYNVDEESLANNLLSYEDRFNFNELLVMLQDTELLGPDCTSSQAAGLFHRVTGDKPTMSSLHPINCRDEVAFDELVELLVRLALKTRGTKQQIRSVAQARTALLELVHGFLIDYYVATDRFYNGNLMRVAHGMEAKIREDEPELAARLQPKPSAGKRASV